jgi:hypothetical protein
MVSNGRTAVYDFDRQRWQGSRGEQVMRRFLEQFGTVVDATWQQQRDGIDFILTCHDGRRYGVECKTDRTAARTGNLFMETQAWINADGSSKPGFIFSLAHIFLFWVPDLHCIYQIPASDIKNRIQRWARTYGEREIANARWTTVGVPVPLKPEIASISRAYNSLPFEEAAP